MLRFGHKALQHCSRMYCASAVHSAVMHCLMRSLAVCPLTFEPELNHVLVLVVLIALITVLS